MNIEQDINILKQLIREYKRKPETQNEFFIGLIEERALENLLTAYEKENESSHYIQSQLDIANAKLVEEKEKNKKIEKELEKHIKFCEQEAEGSLNNEICHIALKFNKGLLDIINKEE